jgi:exopolysaccharide biosynthesis protein
MHIWTITLLLFNNNLWTLHHIKKMSGKCTSVTDSTHRINKTILYSENNVSHISKEVNSLEGQIKVNVE